MAGVVTPGFRHGVYPEVGAQGFPYKPCGFPEFGASVYGDCKLISGEVQLKLPVPEPANSGLSFPMILSNTSMDTSTSGRSQ